MRLLGTSRVVCVGAFLLAAGDAAAGNTGKDAAILGLTPETLAVCGLTTADATAVLQRLHQARPQCDALRAASEAVTAADRTLAYARQALRDDPWNSAYLAQVREAGTALRHAEEAFASQRYALFSVAVDGLPELAVSQLDRCANPALAALPETLRIAPLDEAQSARLVAAWTAKQRAERSGAMVPVEVAQAVSQAAAIPEVVAAEVRLVSNRDAIAVVFAQTD